jgi:hypothetical protein
MFDREDWNRHGFMAVGGVIEGPELEELRHESDRLVTTLSADLERQRQIRWLPVETDPIDAYAPGPIPPGSSQIRMIEPVTDLSPTFERLVQRPEIAGIAAAVFGDDVSLFEDKLNLKLPGGAGFPWHQDWPCCWRANTEELVTCFIYLDDSTRANGCLEVVPNSHAGKQVRPFREGSTFAAEITDDDRRAITPLPLEAGDMIAFHPYLLHASSRNETTHPRRAIIFTYNPARLGDLRTARYPGVFASLR